MSTEDWVDYGKPHLGIFTDEIIYMQVTSK